MSTHGSTTQLTLRDLRLKAESQEKLAVLTCYDATFAHLADQAGVDALLVGDSLGMVMQGRSSTIGVSMADMVYHTRCVTSRSTRALVLTDMPFGSYQENPQQAFRNAAELMMAGAQMVKLEGGQEMASTVEFLVNRGIPVCAHIGLTPQSVHVLGGYRVQGRSQENRVRILQDAKALAQAGAEWVVLEAMPQTLAAELSSATRMLTIGIGASARCTGQVLVLQDMLGLNKGKVPRFVKNFMQGAASVQAALEAYVQEVKNGSFPAVQHTYSDVVA